MAWLTGPTAYAAASALVWEIGQVIPPSGRSPFDRNPIPPCA